MLADEPDRHHPTPRKQKKFRRAIGVTIAAIVILAVVLGSVIRVPKRFERPGGIGAMSDFVVVNGGEDSKGEFFLLTVRVGNEDMRLLEYIVTSLDDEAEVIDTEELLGGLNDEEDDCLSRYEMVSSQSEAQLAAADVLQTDVSGLTVDVVLIQADSSVPAAKSLETCDLILRVDGEAVSSRAGVGDLLRLRSPGEIAEVTVLRNGREFTFDIPTIELKDREGNPYTALGVSLLEVVQPSSLPFGITISPDQITGPSAGLGFALEIIDQLSEGDLAGGKQVAVTGTIDADGVVGPVGGVRLKAIAARRAGAELMLTPRQDVAEAKRGAGKMKVIAVDDLKDALAALNANGGDPIGDRVATGSARSDIRSDPSGGVNRGSSSEVIPDSSGNTP